MTARREYRVVARVGDQTIASPWCASRLDVDADLRTVQDVQLSGEPLQLHWLGLASGSDVAVVYLEERTVGPSIAIAPRKSLTADLYDRPL